MEATVVRFSVIGVDFAVKLSNSAAPTSVNFTKVPLSCRQSHPLAMVRSRPPLYSSGVPLSLYKNGSLIFSISMRPLNTVLRIDRTLDRAEIDKIISEVETGKALAIEVGGARIGASARRLRAAFAQNVIIVMVWTGSDAVVGNTNDL